MSDEQTTAPSDTTADIIDSLRGEIEQALIPKPAGPSPQHCPRASGVDKCERAMALAITHWEQRPPFPEHVVARLERGKAIESRVIVPALMQAGLQVIESQQAVALRGKDGQTICTGHIEGTILHRGRRVLYEIKTVNPNLFDQLDSVDAMLQSDWYWRWPLQLGIYLRAMDVELGLFILDDCLGHVRVVPMIASKYKAVVDEAIQRCERVVNAVAAKILPDYHDRPAHCRVCAWRQAGVCIPPIAETAGKLRILADEEMVEALRVREAARDEHLEYERAERLVSKVLKDLDDGVYLAGPFQVEITRKERAGYTVAPGVTVAKTIARLVDDTVVRGDAA